MTVKRFLAPTLAIVLFLAVVIQLPIAIAGKVDGFVFVDPIIEIHGLLRDKYVVEPDDEAMLYAGIDGMLATLDDLHTQYIPPQDLDAFNRQLRGTYAGIGAEVNIENKYLVIVSPMDESPALKAGVMAGDVVLEIEGESTYEKRITDCVELLVGEAGTPVRIKVRHLDGSEEELVIVRERIVARTIKGLLRHGEGWSWCIDAGSETKGGITYVRLTQFNMDTVRELRRALEEAAPIDSLVLDLRDNPGGGLPQAVGTADLFLDEGLIVSVRSRTSDDVDYAATAHDTFPGDFPMIVLVNRGSASASEIVSGALQENGRAKVLGTRTFGKGSVQEVLELADNTGTLKFTTARYFLKSGRNIDRHPDSLEWGVDPDPGFVVPMSDDEYFEWFKGRRDAEIIRKPAEGDTNGCASIEWIRETLHDEQLAVAAERLAARLRGEAWPEAGDEDPGAVAFNEEIDLLSQRRLANFEELRLIEEKINELNGLAAATGREALVPEGLDLTKGTIALRDKDGNLIGEYEIEGGNVALALEALELKRVGQ